MKLTVTQKNINGGRRGNSEACPLALALEDAGLPGASVGPITGSSQALPGTWAACWAGGRRVRLPTRARDFARAFDRGDHVDPTTFEIETPTKEP